MKSFTTLACMLLALSWQGVVQVQAQGCGSSCNCPNARSCGNQRRCCWTAKGCVVRGLGLCGGAPACPARQLRCDGICINPLINPSHCGRCGNRCGAGAFCDASTCKCRPGFTSCGVSCFNFQTDRFNCGECKKVCGDRQTCVAGKCTCLPGLTLCGDKCVNLLLSLTNCGVCGKACARGESCVAVTPAPAAPAPVATCQCSGPGRKVCAPEGCVNTLVNNKFCGSTCTPCLDGVCVNGACKCPPAKPTFCTGGAGCQNTQTSPRNCGLCGNQCTAAQICSKGLCVASG